MPCGLDVLVRCGALLQAFAAAEAASDRYLSTKPKSELIFQKKGRSSRGGSRDTGSRGRKRASQTRSSGWELRACIVAHLRSRGGHEGEGWWVHSQSLKAERGAGGVNNNWG